MARTSLASKFKKTGDSKQGKPGRSVVPVIAKKKADVERLRKAGKERAVKKKEEIEEKSSQESALENIKNIEAANKLVKLRSQIRERFRYMHMNLGASQPYTKWAKSTLGDIFEMVEYLSPLPASKIDSLKSNKALLADISDIAKQQQGKQRSVNYSENIINDITRLNSLILSYPENYTVIRSKLLKYFIGLGSISTVNSLLRSDYIYDSDVVNLSLDYDIPSNIVEDVRVYNNILEKTLNAPKVEASVIISPPTDYNNIYNTIKTIKKISQSSDLPDSPEEESAESTEDIYTYSGGKRTLTMIKDPNVIGSMKQETKKFEQHLAEQLARETGQDLDDIKQGDIKEFMVMRENLPYMIFFIKLMESSTEDANVKNLLKISPSLSAQFANLFNRLPRRARNNFINSVFEQYPPDEYSGGPTVSIPTLLARFFNSVTLERASPQDELDIKLATQPLDEFQDSVKSLTPLQYLIYRPIIFSRLIELPKDEQDLVLDTYTPYLIFEGILEVDDETSQVTLNGNAISSRDFTVPSDDENALLESINKFININIGNIATLTDIVQTPSRDFITQEKIKIGTTRETLLNFVYDQLQLYYNATIYRVAQLDDAITTYLESAFKAYFSSEQSFQEINISLPAEIVENLSEKTKQLSDDTAKTVTMEAIKQRASQLGINLNIQMNIAKSAAILEIKQQLDENIITETEYEMLKKEIDDFVEAYKQLNAKSVITDADIAAKKRLYAAAYKKILEDLNPENYDESERNDIQELARITALEETGLTQADYELMTSSKYAKKSAAKEPKKKLEQLIKNMPDALKISLKNIVDSIDRELLETRSKKKHYLDLYYKFVTEISLASWAYKEGRADRATIYEIEQKYVQQGELPSPFIKKIMLMLKDPNLTGTDLYNYVRTYITHTTKLIKNPLVRNTKRRKARLDKLYKDHEESGELSAIKNEVPDNLSPYLKECIAIHMLKPWLYLPSKNKWYPMICLSSGISRDSMTPDERKYFNPSQLYNLILKTENGTVLHFYKPTTAYWKMQCEQSSQHSSEDCGTKMLTDPRSSYSDSAQFFEIMAKDPIQGRQEGDNIIIDYVKDTDSIKFLSADPHYYDKECHWFSSRRKTADEYIRNIRASTSYDQYFIDIRLVIRNELNTLLTVLKLKYGINDNTTTIGNAKELEELLYSYCKDRYGSKLTIEKYLEFALEFIIIINPSDPIGKNSKFFTGMVIQASKEYYPFLINYYASMDKKLPEIFYDPDTSDDLKTKIRDYIKQRTEYLIDSIIYNTIKHKLTNLYEDQSSISSLFIRRNNDISALLPDMNRHTLASVCKNKDDYKGLDDSALVYFVKGDDIYCISKLQLSGMALNGVYKINEISFDKDFVDSFKTYTEYAVDDLRKRNKYLKEVIDALVKNPKYKPVFDLLIEQYMLFGDFSPISLEEYGLFDQLQDAPDYSAIIDIITYRINDLLKQYIEVAVLREANAFIDANKNALNELIVDGYKLYHENNPLTPENLPKISEENAPENEEKENRYAMVFAPAVNLVVNHINDTTPYAVSDDDRYIIQELIERIESPASFEIPEYKCDQCNEVINEYLYNSTTVSKTDMKNRFVKFCSAKCFSKFKTSDPSGNELKTLILQKDARTLTQKYSAFTEMLIWLLHSKSNTPENKEELRTLELKLVDLIDSIRDVKIAEGMSADEIWDRVRASPKFIIPPEELLNPKKLKALINLAKKFNIEMFTSDDIEDVIAYYINDIEGLTNVWKKLRSHTAFRDLLYSTISTFNPAEKDASTVQYSTNDNIVDIINKQQATYSAPAVVDKWDDVKSDIKSMLENRSLSLVLDNTELFKQIRMDVINAVERKFPNLRLKFPKDKKKYIINMNAAIDKWVDVHKQAVSQDKKTAKYDYPEQKTPRGTILSSADFIRELSASCREPIDIREFSNFTKKYLIRSKFKENTLNFFGAVVEKYKCSKLKDTKAEYTEFAFNSEKLHTIVDSVMAELILAEITTERSQVPEMPKPPMSFRDKAKLYKRRKERLSVLNADDREYLTAANIRKDRASASRLKSEIVIPGEIPLAIKTLRMIPSSVYQTKEDIIKKLRDMRGYIGKKEREVKDVVYEKESKESKELEENDERLIQLFAEEISGYITGKQDTEEKGYESDENAEGMSDSDDDNVVMEIDDDLFVNEDNNNSDEEGGYAEEEYGEGSGED